MKALVALLPPVVLTVVGLGVWALLRHPRLLLPAAWTVTLVVLFLIALVVTLAGRPLNSNDS